MRRWSLSWRANEWKFDKRTNRREGNYNLFKSCHSKGVHCQVFRVRQSYVLGLRPNWTPFFVRMTNSQAIFGSTPMRSSSKWRSTLETTLFISSIAYFCPMQFRLPALNGIYVNGLVWSLCAPSMKRSGSNLKGCGKYSGSRNIAYKLKFSVAPFGMMRPSSAAQDKRESFNLLRAQGQGIGFCIDRT